MKSPFFFRKKINITCPHNFFYCKTEGICLNPINLCDGSINCLNGDDEINCTYKHIYYCSSGKKIPLNFLCDFEYDCQSREDEDLCGKALLK